MVVRVGVCSDLRCHPMTEVQDGDVVSVRSLVQTQVILQRVLQLEDDRGKQDLNRSVIQKGFRVR